MSSLNRFINSGFYLFADQLLIAIGGWLYWLLVSKLATSTEIGEATTISSFVMLISTLTQLGLEYPLLKRSSIQKQNIFGTTLIIELAIVTLSVPISVIIIGNLFHGTLSDFIWITIGMVVGSSLGFVSRFALLGVSDVRNILLIDLIGNALRFIIGYILIIEGFGTFGLLLSLFLQIAFVSGVTFAIASKRFTIALGSIRNVKEILRDGLSNTPSKLSRVLILSLSVVLLALLGIDESEVGKFYISLMISIFAGSLATSMAFMVIPTSSLVKTDLSSSSLRIGLSLTAPLIVLLLVVPQDILLLIGDQYATGYTILLVLSVAILPSSVVMNAISKYNNQNNSSKLLAIGFVEIAAFTSSFFILVPFYSVIGAAYAILAAFIASAVLSIFWYEQASIKYIRNSCIAIIAGFIVGQAINSLNHDLSIIAVFASIGTALFAVIVLKNTSMGELCELIKSISQVRST